MHSSEPQHFTHNPAAEGNLLGFASQVSSSTDSNQQKGFTSYDNEDQDNHTRR